MHFIAVLLKETGFLFVNNLGFHLDDGKDHERNRFPVADSRVGRSFRLRMNHEETQKQKLDWKLFQLVVLDSLKLA